MSDLEHLIENGLCAMQRCRGYDDWHTGMKDDPNWTYIPWLSAENLWTICQYVVYTWGAMRCEDCKEQDDTLAELLLDDGRDLISRQAAIDAIYNDWCYDYLSLGHCPHENDDYKCDGCDDVEIIASLLSADRPKSMIHIDEVYRLIAGHSNYHGDSILSAFTCLIEGKDVKSITPLDESIDRPTGK